MKRGHELQQKMLVLEAKDMSEWTPQDRLGVGDSVERLEQEVVSRCYYLLQSSALTAH